MTRVLATSYITPTFSWLDITGWLPAQITLAVLLGLAFRHHRDELRVVWEFAASAGVWWVAKTGVALMHGVTYNGSVAYNWISNFDWTYTVLSLIEAAGTLLSVALYAWALQRRHGVPGFGRLLTTVACTAVVATLWTIAGVLTQSWPRLEFVHDEPYYEEALLVYWGLPSWDSALGWIIWYVGLFGGKPTGPISDPPV
jgi:hypothetical protein